MSPNHLRTAVRTQVQAYWWTHLPDAHGATSINCLRPVLCFYRRNHRTIFLLHIKLEAVYYVHNKTASAPELWINRHTRKSQSLILSGYTCNSTSDQMPVFVPIRVAGNTTLTTLADSRQTSISYIVIRVELASKASTRRLLLSSILNRRDLSDQTVSGRTTVPISTVLSPINTRPKRTTTVATR